MSLIGVYGVLSDGHHHAGLEHDHYNRTVSWNGHIQMVNSAYSAFPLEPSWGRARFLWRRCKHRYPLDRTVNELDQGIK